MKKKFVFFMGVLIVCCTWSIANGEEIVIQPGPDDGIDVVVTSVYFGGSLEDDSTYVSWVRVGGWGDYYYSLLRFDISSLPTNITSAKIYLYNTGDTGKLTSMYLDKINDPWDETTLWNNQPSSTNIDTLPVPVQNEWYVIDVTDLYREWKNGTTENYGIKLRPTNNWNKFNLFYSSDYMDDPSLHPKLVIEVANYSPVAKSLLEPIVFDENTLDASESYDPDGFVEAYQWEVVRDDSLIVYSGTAEFITLNNLERGFYDVTLIVTDDQGAIGSENISFAATGPVCTSMYTQAQLDQAVSEAEAAKDLEIAQLTAQNSSLTTLLATANATISSQQLEIANLNSLIVAFQAQVTTLTNNLAAANASIIVLQAQVAALQTDNANLTADLNAANTQIITLHDELAVLTADMGQGTTGLAEIIQLLNTPVGQRPNTTPAYTGQLGDTLNTIILELQSSPGPGTPPGQGGTPPGQEKKNK